MPLHTAQMKNSELTRANVNARFWPSSVMNRPLLAAVVGDSGDLPALAAI
jgi:hypothetical protein